MEKKRNWLRYSGPLAVTTLEVLIIPIAMAQYPKFFSENEWLLPLVVGAAAILWALPLMLCSPARRFYSAVLSLKADAVLFALLATIAICSLFIAGKALVAFHRNHLEAMNASRRVSPTVETVGRKTGATPVANAALTLQNNSVFLTAAPTARRSTKRDPERLPVEQSAAGTYALLRSRRRGRIVATGPRRLD